MILLNYYLLNINSDLFIEIIFYCVNLIKQRVDEETKKRKLHKSFPLLFFFNF